MTALLVLPMIGVGEVPARGWWAGTWSARCRAVRRGDGPGQSVPVSEIAVRAAFSSTVGLLRANAAVRALTARLFTARG